MADSDVQIWFSFKQRRCDECGKFWYHEENVSTPNGCTCVNCTFQRKSQLSTENASLVRRINSLRGVITRMKKSR